MLSSFEPHLEILLESQREFWPELDAVPSNFVLYGGTALALQLGHRVSDDFDFFSSLGFDPDELQDRLPFFRDLDPLDSEIWVHHKRDNLEGFINRKTIVKIAFYVASITCGVLMTLSRQADRMYKSHLYWTWRA